VKLIRKAFLWLFRFALALVAVAIISILLPRSTPPFLAKDGSVQKGSEAALLTVKINGMNQQLLIRGRRKDAPLLLYLNGGPGVPEGILNRIYASELEDDFLTVQWDQRGSGRSYDLLSPPETQSIEQQLADLDAVIQWLKRRYGRQKIVLLGHSWGSILGILYVQRHPENMALYVGVGQVANMAKGEVASFAFANAEARKRRDSAAMSHLKDLGPAPATFEVTAQQRHYVERYGGAFHKPFSATQTVYHALMLSEYNLEDLWRFYDGSSRMGHQLWPEVLKTDFFRQVPKLEVPIAFILGQYDQMTPAHLSSAYFDVLDAPQKRIFWIKDAAHNPHWESPQAFRAALAEARDGIEIR
jgi:proline iminopeptidase